MKYFKKHKISIAKQYYKIISKYEKIVVGKKCKNGNYFVKLKLKPTNNSLDYVVLLYQQMNEKPKVFVLEPNIYNLSNGKKPPHVFKFNKDVCRICLNLPKEIDLCEYVDCIVPWISEWLLNFEIWQITGNWCGGGHSSEPISEND